MHCNMFGSIKPPIRNETGCCKPLRETSRRRRYLNEARKRFIPEVVKCISNKSTQGQGGMALYATRNGMMMNQNSLKVSSTDDEIELTSMEIDCLKLAANGHRSTHIGQELSVSEKEIEIILYCAERKLGARNRLHAIGIAVSQGLIGIEGK